MFEVIRKSNGKRLLVFDVRNDNTGYPHFLIYEDGQWRWASAKRFEPVQKEKTTAPSSFMKRGSWIRWCSDMRTHTPFKCSVCGWEGKSSENYCPDCGANAERKD